MQNKPWYKSQTIQNAIYTYVLAVGTIGFNAWNNEQLTRVDVGAILAATYTLKETIDGRRKASVPIKGGKAEKEFNKVVEEEVVKRTSSITPSMPDFEAISQLPSAESAVSYVENNSNEADSIDNEENDTLANIDFSSLTGKYYLVAQTETVLKTEPKDSSKLDKASFISIEKNQKIFIDGWRFPPEKNSHIIVNIEEYNNINAGEFYVYTPHFKLFNVLDKEVEIEVPTSKIPFIKKNLTAIKLPGYTSNFYLENPIYEGSSFTWAEATKNGQRIPENKQIVDNIIAQAKELDKFRKWLGNKPLIVTSWYRDPRTNRAVGGASNSSHLTGSATDILCPSMSIWTFQSKALEYWKNGGVGKGANRGFVHVASDGWYRVWNY